MFTLAQQDMDFRMYIKICKTVGAVVHPWYPMRACLGARKLKPLVRFRLLSLRATAAYERSDVNDFADKEAMPTKTPAVSGRMSFLGSVGNHQDR
jgi:hypothetical protein